MKLAIVLLLAVTQIKFWSHAQGLGVPCENIRDVVFAWAILYEARSCSMQFATVIDSEGFMITTPSDDSIEGYNIYTNSKIEFLPENLAAKFPKLTVISAQKCSIKKITKKNFQNLNKLRGLALGSNQIEIIMSDTFEDLVLLEFLELRECDQQ